MDHFYEDVYGFSQVDLFALYREMVARFPSRSHFVEVGGFLGRSAVYMAVEIINSNKHIKFDCVDHWQGSEEHKDNEKVNLDTMYEDFLENIKPVKGCIKPIKMDSIEASKLYEPDYLDFVFIDGSHDEKSVKMDLTYWMPRVKPNGVIAGDDVDSEGVQNAVRWFFDNAQIQIKGRQWMVDLAR